MKVAIASAGRFHLLDLAREIDRLGVETSFYSYVPRVRAQKFGLRTQCQSGVLPIVAPMVMWQKYWPHVFPGYQERLMIEALNRAVCLRLKPCDVFVCMSGLYLEAARAARRRYGARIWLERGSRHILSQLAILEDCGARQLPSDYMVERELEGYELADRIVVPARHVAESFAEFAPHLVSKLFVNPYGVDLEQFPQHERDEVSTEKTILFVGSWSRRKGADVLAEAIGQMDGVRLLHVGAIVDVPFPDMPECFEHSEPVPQWRLKDYYKSAHVFAIASREEGLALVQMQALASGLPLVCTTRTGGQDLGLTERLKGRIAVVEPDDRDALIHELRSMLDRRCNLGGLGQADRSLLSWSAYGKRYYEELMHATSSPVVRAA